MPEVRSRLVRIVDDLAQLPDNPELLRLSRCLEVLEWNGSAEAELLIRGLAQLVPKARLAVDADLSIKRLKNHRR
jgi:hypothetical protein